MDNLRDRFSLRPYSQSLIQNAPIQIGRTTQANDKWGCSAGLLGLEGGLVAALAFALAATAHGHTRFAILLDARENISQAPTA
jgi:hypothetical protein